MGSDDVLLQWKSAGAYQTFPRKKKKSNGFALLPFLTSKSELRGTRACSFFIFISREGRRFVGCLASKEKSKKLCRNV
jgi:hypothetical protein